MPICLDTNLYGHNPVTQHRFGDASPVGMLRPTSRCINIGLINNMPDGALKATERQFLRLLNAAAQGMPVHLSLYSLPGMPRGKSACERISKFYSSIEDLWDSHLDGLIVTGTEPRTTNLKDEPYWATLVQVLDWAEENTQSSVWSCLAAHAAVFCADGIARRRLSEKRFGVFRCAKTTNDRLMDGTPAVLHMPHSRWNEIPEKELLACDYRILTRSKLAGVDAFAKQRKSLFIFFQGHPEYDANSLLLEYRRDIGRYLRRERDDYPETPHGYFDAETTYALAALRARALDDRRETLLGQFPMTLAERALSHSWSSSATRIYRNWLLYLSTHKERRLRVGMSQPHALRSKAAAASG